MEKDNNTTQTGGNGSDLKVPQPPDQVKAQSGDKSLDNQKVEQTPSEETVINNNPEKKEEPKVQNHDWNNGKPEVSKDLEDTLDTHKESGQKNPEQKNDEELRKNKGNKEGEPVLEASEEVNTGQNAG